MNWSWLLPESVSTFGPDIDRIYYVVLWITGITFVLTEALLLYFLLRYRHKEGRKAHYTHGNNRLEIVWTVVPAIILLGLAFTSKGVWARVKSELPSGAVELVVEAKQFEWNITYPGADGTLGTDDDFTKRNELHIPVNQPVIVNLRAEDVIHSFFLPEFRVKQDALPGKNIPVWFEATETGEFTLACAELCGIGHYRMGGRVIVHSAADYEAWIQTEVAGGQQ